MLIFLINNLDHLAGCAKNPTYIKKQNNNQHLSSLPFDCQYKMFLSLTQFAKQIGQLDKI